MIKDLFFDTYDRIGTIIWLVDHPDLGDGLDDPITLEASGFLIALLSVRPVVSSHAP